MPRKRTRSIKARLDVGQVELPAVDEVPLSVKKLISIGQTASRPIIVLAGDDQTYLMKRDELDADPPTYAMTQESLAHRFATMLHLPIPPCAYIKHEGSIWFGSRIIPHATPSVRPSQMKDLSNAADLARVMVFDTWICNLDRHPENLILQTQGRKKFWIIDHGFAPVHRGNSLETTLRDFADVGVDRCVNSAFRNCDIHQRDITTAIADIHQISDNLVVDTVVLSTHSSWTLAQRQSVAELFIYRKQRLERFFGDMHSYFSALRG